MPVDICFLLGVVMNILFYIPAFLEFLGKLGAFLFIPVLVVCLVLWLNRQNIVNKDFKEQSTDLKENREHKISCSHLIAGIIAASVCLTTLVTIFWGHVPYGFYVFSVILVYFGDYKFFLTVICALLLIVEKRYGYIWQIHHPDFCAMWTMLKKQIKFFVRKIPTWFRVTKNAGSNVLFWISKATNTLAHLLQSREEKPLPVSPMTSGEETIVEQEDSEVYYECELNASFPQTIIPVQESTKDMPQLDDLNRNPINEDQMRLTKFPKEVPGSAAIPPEHSYVSLGRRGDYLSDSTASLSGSTASHWDGTEKTEISHNPNEGNTTGLKIWQSTLSLASTYSVPNENKGTSWGFTLIFNMITFSKEGLKRRDGAEYDEELIEDALTEVGSNVKKFRNMSKKELLEKLDKYSKKDHSKKCYFACVFLSHGSEEGIYCSDGELLSLSDAFNRFCKKECPSLKTKPKIFFIDACLGDKEQSPLSRSKVWDSGISGLSSTKDRVVGPQEEDFLILYTTVPGHVSLRSHVGSPSVTQFCQLFKRYAGTTGDKREPLVSVIQKLTESMSSETCFIKQIPCVVNTTRRKIYLTPIRETQV